MKFFLFKTRVTLLYLLQLLVLSVHQGLPVIVKLDVVRLNVLQSSLSQYGAVLHCNDLDRKHQNIFR